MNLPNKLTMMRVVLVPVFMVFAALAKYGTADFNATFSLVAGIIFTVASITDFLDGYIARKNHLVTDFGKFMDPIADKLLTHTAFIMLTAIGRLNVTACIIFIAREFVVSGLRLCAVVVHGDEEFPAIIGVDNADLVGRGQIAAAGKPAAGKHQANIALRDLHGDADGDQARLAGRKHSRCVQAGAQISPGRAGRAVGRERRALAQNFNGYLLHHNALRVDSRHPTGRSGRMPASPECR